MELDEAIKSRKSTRKFSDKKPDWRNIIECIDAARYAPMTGNNYTLKFVLVSDEEKIIKISEASQQDFIAKAKFVVVVCSDDSRTANLYGKDSGKEWARQQAGAAIENFLLKIEEFKLATCWIGYFVEDQIKEALKIPAKLKVEALFPIGYEFTKAKTKKAKIDLDNILFFDSYGNKKMGRKKDL